MSERKHKREPTMSTPVFSLESLSVDDLGELLSCTQSQIEIVRIEQPSRSRGSSGTLGPPPRRASMKESKIPLDLSKVGGEKKKDVDSEDTGREVSMLRVIREGPDEPESSRAKVDFLQVLREGPVVKDEEEETAREISLVAALRAGPSGGASSGRAKQPVSADRLVLDVDEIRVRPGSSGGSSGHGRGGSTRLSMALSSAVASTIAASAGAGAGGGADSRPASRGGATSPQSPPPISAMTFLSPPEHLESKDEKTRLEHWRAQRDKASPKVLELVKKAAHSEDLLTELFMQVTKLLQRKQRKRREERKVKMTDDAVVLHAQEVKRRMQHEYELMLQATPVRERVDAIVKLLAAEKDPMEIPFEQRFAGMKGATEGEDDKCVIC